MTSPGRVNCLQNWEAALMVVVVVEMECGGGRVLDVGAGNIGVGELS